MLIATITALTIALSAGGGSDAFVDDLEDRIEDHVSSSSRRDRAVGLVEDLGDRLDARAESVLRRAEPYVDQLGDRDATDEQLELTYRSMQLGDFESAAVDTMIELRETLTREDWERMYPPPPPEE